MPDLLFDGRPLLNGISADCGIETVGCGAFVSVNIDKPTDTLESTMGSVADASGFLCLHRFNPFWTRPKVVDAARDIPVETEFVLIKRVDGGYAILIPLVSRGFRVSLKGSGDGTVTALAETGGDALAPGAVDLVYAGVGDDPFELVALAAQAMRERLGTFKLRKEKSLPDFVDYFGWCTWDAFYREVSMDKVRIGLDSFVQGGIVPKLLILDDGWQHVDADDRTPFSQALVSFGSIGEKFPGGLKPTVEMAKKGYGVERFMVWHALEGYWGGVSPETMAAYAPVGLEAAWSPDIAQAADWIKGMYKGTQYMVPAEHVHRFYQDYYRVLGDAGVDGVKVDNQASIEAFARGLGGRTNLMRAYHEAMEGAAHTHLNGNIINCMCISNDVIYNAKASNVSRSYDDFWPNKPESHGEHVWGNAANSLWMGEFVHPDWDMFQSGHAMGAYHASARAISGGPVYVSDKPDSHDFGLLGRMVMGDGTVARAMGIGRPTADTLFVDPLRGDEILKVFNTNAASGVVGAFNCGYAGEGAAPKTAVGTVKPSDVHGLCPSDTYVVYREGDGAVFLGGADMAVPVELPELTSELFAVVPVRHGFAPIGLKGKMNIGGTITGACTEDGTLRLNLRDGGDLLVWCDAEPSGIEAFIDGSWMAIDFARDASGLLSCRLPLGSALRVRIVR